MTTSDKFVVTVTANMLRKIADDIQNTVCASMDEAVRQLVWKVTKPLKAGVRPKSDEEKAVEKAAQEERARENEEYFRKLQEYKEEAKRRTGTDRGNWFALLSDVCGAFEDHCSNPLTTEEGNRLRLIYTLLKHGYDEFDTDKEVIANHILKDWNIYLGLFYDEEDIEKNWWEILKGLGFDDIRNLDRLAMRRLPDGYKEAVNVYLSIYGEH